MRTSVKLLAVAACVSLAAGLNAEQGQAGIQISSVAHGTSTPLGAHAPMLPGWQPGMQPYVIPRPKQPGNGGGKPGGGSGGGSWTDPDLQSVASGTINYEMDANLQFEGQDFTGAIPPDPNLSVGIDPSGNTQIVQVVNTSYAVYDTTGILLTSGDLAVSLFSGISSSNCYVNGDGGDPIVLWDKFDKRWIISELAYSSDFSQNDFCVAISQTADATGGYDAYDIPFGGSVPDYPKLAVWSDGIYFSANMFKISINQRTGLERSTFLGAQACSFPLQSVTAHGSSITLTCSGASNTAIYNILPADIDGPAPPSSVGSDYYLQFVNNLSTTSGNQLALYQYQNGQLNKLGNLTVGTFHEACGGGTCIPQEGTTQQLDSLGDRLMYRLSYRNYTDHQDMVVNHAVQVSSATNQTGIRWYQLCTDKATTLPFAVCQESTYSPDTSTYRWMGSIAQDKQGNLGLGYSASSNSIYPSVGVTGWEIGTDPATPVAMEPETMIFTGPNFQDTYSRWGDYSSMAVDPKDDCTFWYTAEYSTATNVLGAWNFFWGTRVGSFHFKDCTATP